MIVLSALAGLTAAATVTSRLHESDGFWGRRIGSSSFRRANLPVGGVLAFSLGLALPAGRVSFFAAGAAMTAVAVGWRWVDPLPPVGV